MEQDRTISEPKEATAKRNAKDSVFTDLFAYSNYRFQLFRFLHPEAIDISENDIRLITLKPIILNLPYNDLGLLVKDRLMIFVEAQSRWSINILTRILLYLAMTWKDYIEENQLDIYGTREIDMPKPEFYVICTEKRTFPKDVFSLRDELWDDPDVPVDLKVKVVYSDNKDDIVCQYIIFCRVLDEQEKLFGRNERAVEETIQICMDQNILKDYLETRRKEVVSIMKALFDQETAVENYAKEREKKGAVNMCQRMGATIDTAIDYIVDEFNISREQASKVVKAYWKQPTAV